MRSVLRRQGAVLALATALVASACGSTVEQQGAATDDEFSTPTTLVESDLPPGVGPDGAAFTAGGPSGENGRGPTAGTTATTSATGPGPGGPGPGNFIPAGKGVHGVTDKTIEVGLWTFNSAQGNAALGAAGADPSTFNPDTDPAKAAKAVVDHVNANGGIAGRRVVPRVIEIDAVKLGTASGRSQEAQRACSYWTEDHRVFAFHMISSTDKEGLGCALDTQTLTMSDTMMQANAVLSESMFARYRKVWYSPNFMVAERRERNLVEELVRSNFFTPNAKLAVFYHDKQGPKEGVERGLLPALAARGLPKPTLIAYSDAVEANWNAYAFDLSRSGHTHVIFAESEMSYWPALLAMRAAEANLWWPKWGMASDQNPPAVARFKAPMAQMANATGMAWNRLSFDEFDSEGSKTCDQISKRSGEPGVGMYCEFLFFLKFTLDQASEISLAGFEAALAKVGDRYSAVATVSGLTSFSPGKHDGPSSYRSFAFDSRCDSQGINCWKYTTPVLPLKP